jgi:HK97 family phage prohead protease
MDPKLKSIVGHKRRTFIEGAVKGIDAKTRTIRAYASTNGWDRYGERFEANAFEGEGMKNYLANPVLLFAHRYDEAPIGKSIGHEFDSKGLILTMKFADTPEADRIFKLYEGGFMNAFSVGFRPTEVRWEERAPGIKGLVFVKAELLENSAVPVPANPEAVVIKGFGGSTQRLDSKTLLDLMARPYELRSPEEEPAAEPQAEPATPAAPAEPAPAPAAAPAELEEPNAPDASLAPKSLKEAVGYLLMLGKTAREKGKVEDEAVRSMLKQAVNLCRELMLGPGAESLDGIGGDEPLAEEDAALLKELELLTEAALKSGKATQKDLDELASIGAFIEEKLLGKKEPTA